MAESAPHVVVLTSPGMGHLIPLVEFAKLLVTRHGFSVTFIVPTEGPLSKAQEAFLKSLPDGMGFHVLPPVNLDDLPGETKIETRINLVIERSIPSLGDKMDLLNKTENLVAMVVDLFGSHAFEVAEKLGIPPYVFFPSTAAVLCFFLHLPELDRTYAGAYADMPEPVHLPGCTPILGRDLLDPVQDRKNEAYRWLIRHGEAFARAEGVVLNSFKELEGGAIEALQKEGKGYPPVYPVGPLVQREVAADVNGSGCLGWLDGQPTGSVLFVCFGSGGTLTRDQINELALGLELSEQRFLWVIRRPNDKANATFFGDDGPKGDFDFLPEGFSDRTRARGLLVTSWAPQAQILSHGSTGGFLSHCGWNSTLESVVNGVPLIAWPLYAEQKMNAVSLVEGIKIALRPTAGEDGLIGRLEIARAARALMEGEEGMRIRDRMRELKDAADRTLGEDGSSAKSLRQLAFKWKNPSPQGPITGGARVAAKKLPSNLRAVSP